MLLRQLASRAAASSSQLCSTISASSLALSCSTSRAAVATEVSRGVMRRGASSNGDCDGPRSLSSSPMIASSSGRSSSFSSFDSSCVPSTSYNLVSCWGSLGTQQMRTRVREILE